MTDVVGGIGSFGGFSAAMLNFCFLNKWGDYISPLNSFDVDVLLFIILISQIGFYELFICLGSGDKVVLGLIPDLPRD
jgi:hypothetical protein